MRYANKVNSSTVSPFLEPLGFTLTKPVSLTGRIDFKLGSLQVRSKRLSLTTSRLPRLTPSNGLEVLTSTTLVALGVAVSEVIAVGFAVTVAAITSRPLSFKGCLYITFCSET